MTNINVGQEVWINVHTWDVTSDWAYGTKVIVSKIVSKKSIDVINTNGIAGWLRKEEVSVTPPLTEIGKLDIAMNYFKIIAEYDGHPENMKSIAKEAIEKLLK